MTRSSVIVGTAPARFRRLTLATLGIVLTGLLSGCAADGARRPTAQINEPDAPERRAVQLAEKYGFAAWPTVDQIAFTFHAVVPGRPEPIVRRWEWSPKTGAVTLLRDGAAPLSYTRGDTLPADAANADKAFVNDSFWLLFPFQIVWSNPAISVTRMPGLRMPIGNAKAREQWVVRYGETGYTPGDEYVLYTDAKTGLIAQWEFFAGGDITKGRPATWEDNQSFGPLTISLRHEGPRGSGFKLWFSDVQVRFVDGVIAKQAE